MNTVRIDLDGIKTKAEFYDLIEEKLSTPDYFGRNLDALHDILSGMSVTLEVSSLGSLGKNLGGYAAIFRDMLLQTAQESAGFSVVIKD